MDSVASIEQLTHRCYRYAQHGVWRREVTPTVRGIRGVTITLHNRAVIKYAELPDGDVRVLWITDTYLLPNTRRGIDLILAALQRELVA